MTFWFDILELVLFFIHFLIFNLLIHIYSIWKVFQFYLKNSIVFLILFDTQKGSYKFFIKEHIIVIIKSVSENFS